VTSPCTEPGSPARFRTHPNLLTRRVAVGSLVCVPASSAYQDVRVLRLDRVASALVDSAREPRRRDDVVEIVGPDCSPDEIDTLLDGLCASRVLERLLDDPAPAP
jgi:hypothetical protein